MLHTRVVVPLALIPDGCETGFKPLPDALQEVAQRVRSFVG